MFILLAKENLVFATTVGDASEYTVLCLLAHLYMVEEKGRSDYGWAYLAVTQTTSGRLLRRGQVVA